MIEDVLPIDEHDAELLRRRRRWYYIALGLLLLSALLRQPLVFLAALFTLLIGLVPSLWFQRGLHYLTVSQQVGPLHQFFGSTATLTLTIENRKWLPLPWLLLEDKISPPLAVVSKQPTLLQRSDRDMLVTTWQLWSFQRVTRYYHMRCQARGLHVFGPIRLTSSDPFGWLEREIWLPLYDKLVVYPLIAPVETLGLPAVHPFGDDAAQRQLLEDPLRVIGVRDYVLGDDPRRIHWKATAHAGALRSKIYEPSTVRRLLLLLDTWSFSQEQQMVDTEMQEFLIAIAASLAQWGLDNGYMVGLLANCALSLPPPPEEPRPRLVPLGQERSAVAKHLDETHARSRTFTVPGVSVSFARDDAQYERVLSTLAQLVPRYTTSIELVMENEEEMFPLGTTVVLVGDACVLTEGTIERLLDLRTRGLAIKLVLAGERAGVEQRELYPLPVSYVGGKEKWYELIAAVAGEREGQHEPGEQQSRRGISAASLQLD